MSETTLSQSLEQHTAAALRIIASRLGVTHAPRRKDELTQAIARHLTGAGLARTVARLSPAERTVLADAAHHDGRVDDARVRARFGITLDSRPQQPDDDGTEGRTAAGEPCRLLVCLLAARSRKLLPSVSEEIQGLLPAPSPLPLATLAGEPDAEPKLRIITTSAGALAEVGMVLRLVDARRLTFSATGWPTAIAQRAVMAGLAMPDVSAAEEILDQCANDTDDEPAGPIRPVAWPMLARSAGWLGRSGSQCGLSPKGLQALARKPQEALRDCLHAWQEDDEIEEFRRIQVIRGQTGRGQACFTGPSQRRRGLLAELAHLPVERWVSLDELSRHLQGCNRPLQVFDEVPWDLYISEKRYGSLGYSGSHAWHLIEVRYLAMILVEWLATLGMVDLAVVPPWGARADYHDLWGTDHLGYFSRYDGLRAVRMTALGAFLLERPTPAPQPVPRPTRSQVLAARSLPSSS